MESESDVNGVESIDTTMLYHNADDTTTAKFSAILYMNEKFDEERVRFIYHQAFRWCAISKCVTGYPVALDEIMKQQCEQDCIIEHNAKNRWRIEHILNTKIEWNAICENNRFDATCKFCVLQRDMNKFFDSDLPHINYALDYDSDSPLFNYYTTYITKMKENAETKSISVTFHFYINEEEGVSEETIMEKFANIFDSPLNGNFGFLNIIVTDKPDCQRSARDEKYLFKLTHHYYSVFGSLPFIMSRFVE